jgi:hypothetical protein
MKQREQLSSAQHVFAKRYYSWALEQASTEIAAGFQGFSWIESAPVFHFNEYCSHVERSEAEVLLVTLVRAAHGMGLSLTGESLSSTEIEVLQKYVGGMKIHRSLSPGYVSGVENVAYLNNMQKMARGVRQADPEEIMKAVDKYLPDSDLRLRERKLSNTRRIGSWLVTTECWSDPRFNLFEYSHRIYSDDVFLRRTEFAAHGFSILEWLGIAKNTLWTSLFELDAEDVGMRVANLSKQFLRASERLLKDIPPTTIH